MAPAVSVAMPVTAITPDSLGTVSSVSAALESAIDPPVVVHSIVSSATAVAEMSTVSPGSAVAGTEMEMVSTTAAVAVKVIAVIPDTVAVTVFVPAVEPSVSVADARPPAFVVTLEADSDPPPAVTAKATVTPDSASPSWSRTSTMNGWGSAASVSPA